MQKIDRFRYIDDSASSSTTITSPVESIERAHATYQPCSHLITSAIEQFDDYVRAQYPHDAHEDINSLIDRLDSELIINGSYSDLNILNQSSITRERPQSFKPVNDRSFQPTRVSHRTAQSAPLHRERKTSLRLPRSQAEKEDRIVHLATALAERFQTVQCVCFQSLSDYQRKENRPAIHSSAPITIPHSVTSLPLASQHGKQRTHTDSMKISNGHSRSMDFPSFTTKRDLIRPVALVPTIAETSSSSSTATLTSLRSSTSLEFDDNTKPSGVLVDDDFLPMSSPVDDHFWNMTTRHQSRSATNNHDSFPNVGSSPDLEIKRFDLQHIYTLSETSCDDEDDDEAAGPSSFLNRGKTTFTRQDFKVKAPVRLSSQPAAYSSIPSINNSEQSTIPDRPLSIRTYPSDTDRPGRSLSVDCSCRSSRRCLTGL